MRKRLRERERRRHAVDAASYSAAGEQAIDARVDAVTTKPRDTDVFNAGADAPVHRSANKLYYHL